MKIVADIIAIPLCRIINLSFSKGIFPDLLKTVKVIALFKSGSADELNNYRPISLLSIFDKIMEKIMHSQLYDFFEYHQVLFKNQFGFRKKCSTAHSLIEITEKIKESIDSGKFGCGIFIDLKKSFWYCQPRNPTKEAWTLWGKRSYLKMVWIISYWP